MSTRSTIAKVQEDGQTIRSIYCHFDGYPEYVGKVLQEYYTHENKIDQLLALGDLSILDKEIGETQTDTFTEPDFTRKEGYCLAYGRDRGEMEVDALVHANQNEWLGFRAGSWCEYGYLWDGSTWHVYEIGNNVP